MYAIFWRMSVLVSRLFQNWEGITIYEIWDFRASSDHGRIHICTISAYFGRLLYKKSMFGWMRFSGLRPLGNFPPFLQGRQGLRLPVCFRAHTEPRLKRDLLWKQKGETKQFRQYSSKKCIVFDLHSTFFDSQMFRKSISNTHLYWFLGLSGLKFSVFIVIIHVCTVESRILVCPNDNADTKN